MTNREIADSFARDLGSIPRAEFDELLTLSSEDGFADEAGMEFMWAVATVGIDRVSL
jgi:hypothetical protein